MLARITDPGLGDAQLAGEVTPPPAKAGGLVRHADGHVDLRYGYLGLREIRLPATIWDQILAAIRSRAVDGLDR